MSYSSGLVLAPVDLRNIRDALGSSSLDLGTLCTSGNINVFSKKKPIGISGVNPSASQWEAAHFGLKGPATSTRNSLATMSTDWTYDGATGGNYRALDFDGYYNGAIPPFRQANGTQLLVDLVGGNADAALFHLFMAEGGIANKPLSTSQGTASSGTASWNTTTAPTRGRTTSWLPNAEATRSEPSSVRGETTQFYNGPRAMAPSSTQ